MGIVIRQSLISTALNYFGVALGAFNALWLFPKAMTTGEIGLYRVIIGMAFLFVPFAQMGISQSSIKFFPEHKSQLERNRFLTVLFLLALISFIVFLGAFNLFKTPIINFFETRSPEVIDYFDLVLALVFLMVIYGILESYSRNILKIIFPNFIKEVFLRFFTTILVFLFLMNKISFDQMLYALLINYIFAVLLITGYLGIKYKIRLNFQLTQIKKKPLIQYALFTLLGTGGAVIVMQIDSILVTGLLGLDKNGIYSTAFFMAVVVEIPRRAISQLSSPLISRAFHDEDVQEIDHIYKRTSINLLIAGSLVFALIYVNLDNIFYLIPNWQRFESGKIVVVIIGLAKLIDMASGVNTEIIIMSRYYRFNLIAIVMLAILTIITNLWLIPIYELKGAAIATAISLVFYNFVKFLFILIKLKIQPFSIKTLLVILIALFNVILMAYTPSTGHYIFDIILHSTIICILFLILNYWMKTSEDLIELFHSIWRKIIR